MIRLIKALTGKYSSEARVAKTREAIKTLALSLDAEGFKAQSAGVALSEAGAKLVMNGEYTCKEGMKLTAEARSILARVE
jgi:hypothetical protein